MPAIFVSGIDTNVGKTIATGLMARYLVRLNYKVITVKPVQTGNDGFSEDLRKHRELMEVNLLPEDLTKLSTPVIFQFPASPHLAAKLENTTVPVNKIEDAIRELNHKYDYVLIEGAGGLMVPLTEDLLTIDWVRRCGFPVVLVSSSRLGSLNHTLLSLEALRAREMTLLGIVYNWSLAENSLIARDTHDMIVKYLPRYNYHCPVVTLPEIVSPMDVKFDFLPVKQEEI